jgi:hypothetical protein
MAMTLNLVPFLVLADSSFLDALFMILLLHLTYYNTNQIIMLFPDSTSVELGTLNDALQELLDGIQVALQEWNRTHGSWWKEVSSFSHKETEKMMYFCYISSQDGYGEV